MSGDWSRENLMRGEQKVISTVKSAWQGFKDFAMRDSVLEVAIGLVIAQAFTAVVTSFVSNILLPPLSLLPFMGRDFEEKFAVLRRGPHYNNGYNTLAQARADGAVTMAYGLFVSDVVRFFGIGLALYGAASLYGFLSNNCIIKHTSNCGECRKEISEKATRCPWCTTWLDGRDDSSVAPPPPNQ